MARFDIIVVTDVRFSGGSASAVIADVQAFSRLGLRTGLLFVTSHFFDGTEDRPNKDVLDLQALPGVEAVHAGDTPSAGTVFCHHPLPFFSGVRERLTITADRAVIVAHHPPFRGDGSLEYDPMRTAAEVKRAIGMAPIWAPVSGVVRRQLRSFAPFLRMTSEDWVNAFDLGVWIPKRTAFSGDVPTVGRHSRPDLLKWPDRAADVTAPMPADRGWRVRVMGCPETALQEMGADLSGWEVLPFGTEPVPQFVESLDVFAYFHGDRWVEAFGRTVVEAMLMERPCLLDRRLEATFGTLADYCAPSEAPAALERLRATPAAVHARAADVRRKVHDRYSIAEIGARLTALEADRGTISRTGEKQASIPVTCRKLIGLRRREHAARQEVSA
ncbi:MAG: glycosyltransferase family 1 protein [Pseudomonadota bacterium]